MTGGVARGTWLTFYNVVFLQIPVLSPRVSAKTRLNAPELRRSRDKVRTEHEYLHRGDTPFYEAKSQYLNLP